MPNIGDPFNPYRMFNGILVPDAVYRFGELSAIAKLLYGRLCRFKGESGDAFPSADVLAAELGITKRQIFSHISGLVERGFLRREVRPGKTTIYEFLWHESFENIPVKKTSSPQKEECRKLHGGGEENFTGGVKKTSRVVVAFPQDKNLNSRDLQMNHELLRESIKESQLREPPLRPPKGEENLFALAPPDTDFLAVIGWTGIKHATEEQISALDGFDADPEDDTSEIAKIKIRLGWFDEFWGMYWRKVGKKKAREVYFVIVTTLALHEKILQAIDDQTEDMLSRTADKIPHATTWLNGGRWNDEVAGRVS